MRRIVFPRHDPPPGDPAQRAVVGTFLMFIGGCAGCYVAPLPLMIVHGSRAWAWPASFLMLAGSVALFVHGHRLRKRP